MKEPKFLFQSGNVLSIEKFCVSSLNYPYEYCSYDDLSKLDIEKYRLKYIPLGSVQYAQKFCEHCNLILPESISYYEAENFLKRKIREGKLKDAESFEFVKPKKVKQFTGDIKSRLRPLSPENEVWISEPVPFESEFRFYIQDYANKWEILGWSRYDDLNIINPDPDMDYVNSICKEIHDSLGPNAYTVDIGWRPDLQQYDLVEINDAWSLGFYNNTDPQSKPLNKYQYTDMLISRWRQILFCSIV